MEIPVRRSVSTKKKLVIATGLGLATALASSVCRGPRGVSAWGAQRANGLLVNNPQMSDPQKLTNPDVTQGTCAGLSALGK